MEYWLYSAVTVDSLSFTSRIRLRRKARECALTEAREIVPERLRERFDEIAEIRYWFGASMLVSSHLRIPLLAALWPALKAHERPEVFASWFSSDDIPEQCHEFLLQALGEFKLSRQRIFDCEAARMRFAQLPDRVTLYRGGLEREAIERGLGISWWLSRDTAVAIATKILRSGAQPALMSATVKRNAIAGLLVERSQDEVLIVPDDVYLDRVESITESIGALPEADDAESEMEATQPVAPPVMSVFEATMPIVALPYRS